MIVMKFGGSSIATAKKIQSVAETVAAHSNRDPVVVVSAHGKTTDNLIHAANQAMEGFVELDDIASYHYELIESLGLVPALVEPLLNNLRTLLHGVSLVRELTHRTLDRIMSFGERMSTRIVAGALSSAGVPAVAVNSYEVGLITSFKHGNNVPLPDIGPKIKKELSSYNLVPVVTGFLGADRKGYITTLGRSGSDYSASILGASIDAEEVQIWTDVSGVMTCDPSLDSRAQSLPVLSVDEASELAYYGAEVIHQNTLLPVIEKAIPVRVLNTAKPNDKGTMIVAETVLTDKPAKSIVYKEDVCLINLASPRLLSAAELLGTALETLMTHHVGIRMATTSEASVSMVTDQPYEADMLEEAIEDLKRLGQVSIEREKAIICVVGEEMKGAAGVLGEIFSAISAEDIKARMVSQSASETNVAFLVDNNEIEPAVRALHALII